MKKFSVSLIVILLIAAAVVIGGRIFNGGEDTWLCDNGQWVKHGNPARPMPTEPCTVTAPEKTQRQGKQTTSREQTTGPTATFTSDDFFVTYPNWPRIDPKNIAEVDSAKVAVNNAGCAFIVTARQIPQDQESAAFLEQVVAEQMQQTNAKLKTKDISATTTHIIGEFAIGAVTIHSEQFGFVTSKRQVYSVLFAAEKKTFETACKPFIDAVVESVKVQ